ncbi:(2Fe-2S)-binding protein, partial [Clostridium haemolyticum]|uniref:(2Fe-2S)-binding protein n=1 Tax=Clostridium haemolyticum TaxID=84025 RepID=UPI001FA8B4D7
SSCSYLAVRAEGHTITTIDGVQDKAKEIGEFLAAEGAEQCGYCSPGFVMNVIGMEKELKNPTEEEIQHYLVGNLCRCSGYVGQLRALKNIWGCLNERNHEVNSKGRWNRTNPRKPAYTRD